MPTARAEQLAQTLSRLADRFPQWAEHSLAITDLPLTPRRLELLTTLDSSAQMRMVVQKLQVSPAVVTTLADRLVDLGYLQRLVDPWDRRAIELEITATGRGARDDAIERLAQILAAALGDLSAPDLHAVTASLEILERLMARITERAH